jgi:type IV secretory pathway ATPase VirB11/archaellum biosynthesis ATPase
MNGDLLRILSGNQAAALTSGAAILGTFLTVIFWPTIRAILAAVYANAIDRIEHSREEQDRLEATIWRSRHLPALPSTLLSVKTSQPQELDALFVSVTLSGSGDPEPTTLEVAIQKYPAIMLLGGPGAGKTTIARFLALMCARARRHVVREAVERLKSREARHYITRVLRLRRRYFPVFISLSTLNNLATDETLPSLLQGQLSDRTSIAS